MIDCRCFSCRAVMIYFLCRDYLSSVIYIVTVCLIYKLLLYVWVFRNKLELAQKKRLPKLYF